MANDLEQERRREVLHRFWPLTFRVGDAMTYAPPLYLFALFFFSGQGGEAYLRWLPVAWTAFYLVVALGVTWHAYYADDMPLSRSLSVLVAGAAPGSLLVPGSPLSQKPLIWAALPALIAWGVSAQFFAYHRLPVSTSWRKFMFAAGAAGCAAGAIGSVLWVGVWRNGADRLGWVVVALSAAGLCLWQAARLLGRLARD